VSISIKVGGKVRPVRVLNTDAEINGRRVIVQFNQLYSQQEKYVLLEVEVPPTKANKTLEVAQVEVSYANMETKTTDHLTGKVSVNFDPSEKVVKQRTNVEVMTECVLQIANDQNILATALRDKGDIEGAKQVLSRNAGYLKKNAFAFDSEELRRRSASNAMQAEAVASPAWGKTRKMMIQDQYMDATQQKARR